MEEKEDSIDNLLDTEYSKYNQYKDRVLDILGIGNRNNRLDPSMDTTLEELKKLWNTEYPHSIDVVDSSGSIVDSIDVNSIGSDEPPQPKVSKLTIEGLHKLEGGYRSGKITDTLHNNDYYIVELHTHSLIPIEATIHREPLEDSKIRIDIRESGKASVRYHTHREGFRNRKDFATELFALADDYIEGEYYK
jgi:hypothetical protein